MPPRVQHEEPQPSAALPLLPQIVDTYVLSNFLFYFVLWLASFVSMTQIYNFFELLGDIVSNKIPLSKVFTYLFFLTPQADLRHRCPSACWWRCWSPSAS